MANDVVHLGNKWVWLSSTDDGALDPYVALGCQRASDMNKTKELIEAGCKGSGDFAAQIGGSKSATANVNALILFDAAEGIEEVDDAFDNDTILYWKVSTSETGDREWKAQATVNDLTVNFGYNEVAAFDFSLAFITNPSGSAVA